MTDELKALWRHQAEPVGAIALEDLRAGANAQVARLRRARFLLVACTLAGGSLAAKLAVGAPTELLRLGEALLGAGFLVMLILGWRRLSSVPPDTTEACVTFLRQTLAQRQRAARGGWIALIAPLSPGLGVMIAGLVIAAGGDWLRLAPIAALLALWLAILLVIQAREAAKVAAEIAWLDTLSEEARTAPTPP